MTAAIVAAALIVGGLGAFVALSGGATPSGAPPPDGPVPARVSASPEVTAWDRLVAGAPAYTGPERRSGLDRRRNSNSGAGWALVDRIIDDALAAIDGDRAAAARIRGMKAAGHQAPSSSLNLASLGDLPRANGGPVASGQVVIIGSGDPELFVPCPTVFVERTPLAQDAFDARRRGPQ